MHSINVFAGLFLTLLVLGVMAPMARAESEDEDNSTSTTIGVTTTAVLGHDQAAVEKRVREYFADVPVMIEIARCESKFRQFTDSGAVLRSAGMIGVFQFYEVVHSNAARALGHDLATLEGNLAYARHLYTQSGTQPWSACVPSSPPSADANVELQIQLMTQLIVLLQELLKLKLAAQ